MIFSKLVHFSSSCSPRRESCKYRKNLSDDGAIKKELGEFVCFESRSLFGFTIMLVRFPFFGYFLYRSLLLRLPFN